MLLESRGVGVAKEREKIKAQATEQIGRLLDKGLVLSTLEPIKAFYINPEELEPLKAQATEQIGKRLGNGREGWMPGISALVNAYGIKTELEPFRNGAIKKMQRLRDEGLVSDALEIANAFGIANTKEELIRFLETLKSLERKQ